MTSSSSFPTSRRSNVSRTLPPTIVGAESEMRWDSRDLAVDIRSVQSWAMTAQVADRYRRGRTFLIGDAAHRFPPTGGLGLNTGVHDAHNLAWKMAWEISGRAPANLLDTYEAERRPIGIANTEHSVKNFDGLKDVYAALGLPRSGTSALQALAESRLMAACRAQRHAGC